MQMTRRLFLTLAIAAAVAGVPQVGRTQVYPSRPITLVVFVPPGGAPDILARLVGQALSPRLGQPIVIDNRAGAACECRESQSPGGCDAGIRAD